MASITKYIELKNDSLRKEKLKINAYHCTQIHSLYVALIHRNTH